jgi:hypothetical protein
MKRKTKTSASRAKKPAKPVRPPLGDQSPARARPVRRTALRIKHDRGKIARTRGPAAGAGRTIKNSIGRGAAGRTDCCSRIVAFQGFSTSHETESWLVSFGKR